MQRPKRFLMLVLLALALVLCASEEAVVAGGSQATSLANLAADVVRCNGQCPGEEFWSFAQEERFGTRGKRCGPAAGAAILADMGCEEVRKNEVHYRKWVPFWGFTPTDLAALINSEADRDKSCHKSTNYKSWSTKSPAEFLTELKSVTENGYPAGILVRNGKKLHWIVLGEINHSRDECWATVYDGGYRGNVSCRDFLHAAGEAAIPLLLPGLTAVTQVE